MNMSGREFKAYMLRHGDGWPSDTVFVNGAEFDLRLLSSLEDDADVSVPLEVLAYPGGMSRQAERKLRKAARNSRLVLVAADDVDALRAAVERAGAEVLA